VIGSIWFIFCISDPNTGGIHGGKGLLAVVEFVADQESKHNFLPDQKIALQIQVELKKRGVLTRTRPSAGEHPNPIKYSLLHR
jgi:adenosylmethionine-8-amino-7-oxononanoate aminotransferase